MTASAALSGPSAATSTLRASVVADTVTMTGSDPQPGDSAYVLVDGSDTPITANGLGGYQPTPGDRLLVARVGSTMEILQFISTGTPPFGGQPFDPSQLQAEIDATNQTVSDTSDDLSDLAASTADYQTTTDGVLSTLQSGYANLTGIGAQAVVEDYFWVGDDPTLSTTKLVAISQFVQAALYAGDNVTLGGLLGLLNTTASGDVTYTTTTPATPPKTTFYAAFQAAGMPVQGV